MAIPLQASSIKTIIDDFMVNILTQLENAAFRLTDFYVDDATTLCGIMMLFYLTIQAYTLMTGDGKVSLIPLLRPFIFFLIVVNWGSFVTLLTVPLDNLDAQAKNRFTDVRIGINDQYQRRSELQLELIERLYEETEEQKQLEESGNVWDKLASIPDALRDAIQEKLAKASLVLTSRLSNWFQRAVETLILIFFKGAIYFLYFLRVLLIAVLRLIGPFMFALSIVNAYRELYLQWISKFVAVSLYGVFAHFAIMLAFLLVSFALDLDITFLEDALQRYEDAGPTGGAVVIAIFGQANSGGFALVIAAVTGIFGLLVTPLVATWVLGANSTTQVGNKAIAGAANGVKNVLSNK